MKIKLVLLVFLSFFFDDVAFGQLNRLQRLKISAISFKLTKAKPHKTLKSICFDFEYDAPFEGMIEQYHYLSSPADQLSIKVDGKATSFEDAIKNGIIKVDVDSKDEVTFNLDPTKANKVSIKMKGDMVVSPYANDILGVKASKTKRPKNLSQQSKMQHEHWLNESLVYRQSLVDVLMRYDGNELADKISAHDFSTSYFKLSKSDVKKLEEHQLYSVLEFLTMRMFERLDPLIEQFRIVPMPHERTKIKYDGILYDLVDFVRMVGLDEKHFAKCLIKAASTETIGDYIDSVASNCFFVQESLSDEWSLDQYLVLELILDAENPIQIIIPLD